jgi:hypothetical protein
MFSCACSVIYDEQAGRRAGGQAGTGRRDAAIVIATRSTRTYFLYLLPVNSFAWHVALASGRSMKHEPDIYMLTCSHVTC